MVSRETTLELRSPRGPSALWEAPTLTRQAETSKFLSYVLRHQPQAIGLSLDREGWASISELVIAATQSGWTLDANVVRDVVASSDKRRFEISEDGRRIRAVHGHSTPDVSISYPQESPPKFLYHGTAKASVESVLRGGLRPGKRQYVHLSEDARTATTVGQRHGKPTVLRIEAHRMHEQGFRFLRASSGVWLIEAVPSQFIAQAAASSLNE